MTDGQIDNNEWRWVFISSGLLILLTLIPIMWAYLSSGSDTIFMGTLVNPADAASYIAKIRQGAEGEWLFRLTFTPEDHTPVFLFTFYLFIGHIARWLTLPLALVYHIVRVIGSLFMFLMLYIFAADWSNDIGQRRITWGLAAVGGGFGWIRLLATGYITPEFSIPEAYPLYASFANPHFPWAIALILFMAHRLMRNILGPQESFPKFGAETLGLIAATLVIVAIQPFAPLAMGLGVGVLLAWRWLRRRRFPKRELAWASVVLISALPQLLYGLWAVSPANPVLNAWMAQNQTPSPPPLDYLLGFAPLILLAGLAIWKSWPQLSDREHEGDIFLLGWLITNSLLLYVPIDLQRRLSIGLILPLAIFAGRGLVRVVLPLVRRRWRPLLIAGVFTLAVPSTVLALTIPVQGIVTGNEFFYITSAEADALNWLDDNAAAESIVLAAPSFSLFIPGSSNARVLYGHPFETIRAEERLSAVLAFYEGEDCGLIADESIDYVIYGPREDALGGECRPDDKATYTSGNVSIYQVGD